MSVPYTLTRKPIKNINLRVKRDGSVAVSAPYHISRSHIDAFVISKQSWIQKVQRRLCTVCEAVPVNASNVPTKLCLERFVPHIERALSALDLKPVTLRVRTCTSRWGSCQPKARIIMLNRSLYPLPQPLIEYVALHECVHLLIPNHGADFHALMQLHMPDYKQRRKALRRHGLSGVKP